MRLLLRLVLAAAVIVVIVAVTKHVIGQHSAATTTTTVVSTTTTVAPASSACHEKDFTGAFNQGQGAAGTIYASVTLTKSTSGTCTLKGWPIVTLQDNLGAIIPVTNINVASSGAVSFPTAAANHVPQTLHLSQGEFATFSLAYSDVPTGTQTCPSAATLSVQFSTNGDTVVVTPNYAPQPCGGKIWLSPFY